MAHEHGVGAAPTAGLLLTGGASRRMGFAKGTLVHLDEPVSRTLGMLLGSVTDPTFEVGPGYSGLPTVEEASPGLGPVSAVVAGWEACRSAGAPTSVIALACDLPFVTRALLAWLASRPGGGSVVPVVDGRAQPLCARWSAGDVERMRDLVARGDRSFRPLYRSGSVFLVDEGSWGSVAEARAFADADSPGDLQRLGLSAVAGVGEGTGATGDPPVTAPTPPPAGPRAAAAPRPGRGPSPR